VTKATNIEILDGDLLRVLGARWSDGPLQ